MTNFTAGLAALMFSVLMAGTVGCSSDDDASGAPTTTTQAASTVFVGETTLANETSIAVVVGAQGSDGAEQGAAYICDGVATEAWFKGTVKAGEIDLTSADGGSVKGRVEGDRVVGKLQIAGQPAVDFTASVGTGAAGLYLVNYSPTTGKGKSANGADLDATIDANAVAGTIKTREGAQVPLTGTVKTWGEASGAATWIVQSDGDVKGRATKQTATGTAGGGSCSAWAGIKSLLYGVDCSFF